MQLKGVPDDRRPLTTSVIPKSVAKSYWRYLGGENNPSISPKNPYGFLADIFTQIRNMEEAAQGYFGMNLSELQDIQMVYLLAIITAPTHFDPWCKPDNHQTRFQSISKSIGITVEYESIDLLPPPHGCK